MYIAILGRQPAIGIAELERLYGDVTWFSDQTAIINTPSFDFERLGGTQKAGSIIAELPHGDWRRVSMKIVQHYADAWKHYDGKITLGISAYGFSESPRDIQKTGIILKGKLKQADVSLRLIPNSEAALSTATSHHNKLGLSDNKIELLVVKSKTGKIIIAESIGAQNITAYARRDQERPKRDAFVGMLPPKLAQIMVNLAVSQEVVQTPLPSSPVAHEQRARRSLVAGPAVSPPETGFAGTPTRSTPTSPEQARVEVGVAPPRVTRAGAATQVSSRSATVITDTLDPKADKAPGPLSDVAGSSVREDDSRRGEQNENDGSNKTPRLLDPFCGTGVILQEAALMGYAVYGTDLADKMIDYTDINLKWLEQTHHVNVQATLAQGDATTTNWQQPIDAVVCESYLGQPFNAPPSPAKLTEVRGNCNHIISAFLKNIGAQLQSGTPLCIAVPAWKAVDGTFTHLPLIRELNQLGYSQISFKTIRDSELLYHREDQIVARELLVLVKA